MYNISEITNKRNSKGQFIKGQHPSPKTEFKKGEHWRSPKLFWNKNWLFNEYIKKKKSATQIAIEQKCEGTNIYYFLHKLNIPVRTTSEIRKNKYWGSIGKKNGMYGRNGKSNPNWNGGHSPERQTLYARSIWKELAKSILKRDDYKCQRCGAKHTIKLKLVVHHIKPWSKYPKLRFIPSNLITFCEKCHKIIHKKKLK